MLDAVAGAIGLLTSCHSHSSPEGGAQPPSCGDVAAWLRALEQVLTASTQQSGKRSQACSRTPRPVHPIGTLWAIPVLTQPLGRGSYVVLEQETRKGLAYPSASLRGCPVVLSNVQPWQGQAAGGMAETGSTHGVLAVCKDRSDCSTEIPSFSSLRYSSLSILGL